MKKMFEKLGIHIPEILLPKEDTDLTKWAVIACDQYTSQPDYWQNVDKAAGNNPSALRLTLPEIYLNEDEENIKKRLTEISKYMEEYLSKGILKKLTPGFILVDRSTPQAASRKGLIMALDLEQYDYTPGSTSLIRATEGTVMERIPPRLKIRENALIELPHVMVLINDPDCTLIEELFKRTDSFRKLYDFDLMQNAGHIRGWKIDQQEVLSQIAASLQKLCYSSNQAPFLFAVGDGNHSLATAKVHWENMKAAKGLTASDEHPARYALVEVVNVHDEGIVFEPIHRVLFGIKAAIISEALIPAAAAVMPGSAVEYRLFASHSEMEEYCKHRSDKSKSLTHVLPFIIEGQYGALTVENPPSSLEAGTLQPIIDRLLNEAPSLKVDYIHGSSIVTQLGSRKGCVGFFLPAMPKNKLFETVASDGVLPKKTFSMGEAEEKRHYLECREIR